MNTKWRYRIELTDENTFQKVANISGTDCPEELKELIRMANGASPENKLIMINGKERVLGAILSFNENEKDADNVYSALIIIGVQKQIPFGIDPFGNYYCYSGVTKTVTYWEHEENLFIDTNMSIREFVNSLY